MAPNGKLLWSSTGYDFGIPLMATGANSPYEWDAISDRNGGVFVVWSNTALGELQAVRIDHQGNELWRTKNISSYLDSKNPVIASDGAGGTVVSWLRLDSTTNSYKVMAQRLDPDGKALWKNYSYWNYAVEVVGNMSLSKSMMWVPVICTDNIGGATIGCRTWLYHLNDLGQITDSIDLVPGPVGSDNRVVITGDGFKPGPSGVYAAWSDGIKGEIYAQKYHTTGVQWKPNDVLVTSDDSVYFRLNHNESNELLIGWVNRTGTKLSAQKFNFKGKELWSPGGALVVKSLVAGSAAYPPEIISDRKNGAILVWVDSRSGDPDLYAQRLNSFGIEQWTSGGELICKNIWGSGKPGYSNYVSIVGDGFSGVLIAYQTNSSGSWNVRVDQLSLDGKKKWSTKLDDDAYYGGQGDDQEYPKIIFDGSGPDPTGVIMVFNDEKKGLCAQKIAVSK